MSKDNQKQVNLCPLCYQPTHKGGRKRNIIREGIMWHQSCYLFFREQDISRDQLEGILKRYRISQRIKKDLYNERIETAIKKWNNEHKKNHF